MLLKFMEKQNVKLRIYNIQGQLLQSRKFADVFGNLQTQINLTGYQGGIYYMQLISDKNVFTAKIVVE